MGSALLIAAVALPFGNDGLGVRSAIGHQRFTDRGLVLGELTLLVAARVALVTRFGLNYFSFCRHDNNLPSLDPPQTCSVAWPTQFWQRTAEVSRNLVAAPGGTIVWFSSMSPEVARRAALRHAGLLSRAATRIR